MAQRVGDELLANALLHAVQATKRRPPIVVGGKVAREEQAEERTSAAAVFVFGKGDGPRDGRLRKVVSILVQSHTLVVAEGQAGADDFCATKPLGAGVPQGDADDTTGDVTDVGGNTTRDDAHLLDGAFGQGTRSAHFHPVDVVPRRAGPRSTNGDAATSTRRTHTGHSRRHRQGVTTRQLLDVFTRHRTTGRAAIAVDQRNGVLDDLGFVHHHTRPKRGVDELDFIGRHLDTRHLLRRVTDKAEQRVIRTGIDRLDGVLTVEIGGTTRDLVSIQEQHHVDERQRLAGLDVGHFSFQRSRARLRERGIWLEQHRQHHRGNAEEWTEDGAGRFVAAG